MGKAEVPMGVLQNKPSTSQDRQQKGAKALISAERS